MGDSILYPSKYIENAVKQLSKLPGIGEKTALRMVLYLLRKNEDEILDFGKAFVELNTGVSYCRICFNVSESETCSICSDDNRDRRTICVVENLRGVINFERTSSYNGLYHVLGGLISPMDGIGPDDLQIESLVHRVNHDRVEEVILALSTTMEGDTTAFYINRKLKDFGIKVTAIARGVSIGNDLDYTDELTLGNSIKQRRLYDPDI